MDTTSWIDDFLERTQGQLQAIETSLSTDLAPARYWIAEWQSIFVDLPGVDSLTVGSEVCRPLDASTFLIKFENQVGLTVIVPFAGGKPIGAPLHLEVISGKLGSPGNTVSFMRSMLEALFAESASVAFASATPTGRMVQEAGKPPTDLFVYYFLRWHRETINRALQVIHSNPQRRLIDVEEYVRPHQVKRIDSMSLRTMVQQAKGALPDSAHLTPLERLRPERVLQRLPVDSFDTPENRFTLTWLRQLQQAIEHLARRKWYRNLSAPASKAHIREIREHLQMVRTDPRFDGMRQSTQFPASSRVLQRRDGYREMTDLWQRFQYASSPIFQNTQRAIDLRKISDLYETWVLFELVARIKEISEVQPIVTARLDPQHDQGFSYLADFPGLGKLSYQDYRKAYSGIRLIPDFVWTRANGTAIALDAKFRMDNFNDLDDGGTAKVADIHTMHAYRDAIPGIQASIACYPGTVSEFYSVNGGKTQLSLADVVLGVDLHGVGMLGMHPTKGIAE